MLKKRARDVPSVETILDQNKRHVHIIALFCKSTQDMFINENIAYQTKLLKDHSFFPQIGIAKSAVLVFEI